ncbi:hypothetical protein [Thermosipho sp. (in: thermotogales)]|jgi:beta-xylosidase|uniref:hypothetical protein n=1 Tax=Thermosipho sp. (in: thermotogales) TaxID=1968895 RepID=UPI00257EA1C4|nr:hypothetical protein [Thermosipho sp. (in: thermotogales)]MBZ4649218.1 hypothetical protein [Thermosipho sp. (in: thermotogales)]
MVEKKEESIEERYDRIYKRFMNLNADGKLFLISNLLGWLKHQGEIVENRRILEHIENFIKSEEELKLDKSMSLIKIGG